jgi:hypothetical protein
MKSQMRVMSDAIKKLLAHTLKSAAGWQAATILLARNMA